MPLFNLDRMDNSKGQTARNDDLRNTIGDENAVDDDIEGEGDGEDDGDTGAVNGETSSDSADRKSGFASWTPHKKEEAPASELV